MAPIDVQKEIIEYDPEADAPLPVVKPQANRGALRKAIDMLAAAERPLIVAGGGIINADAADLLVEFAELTYTPVVPTLMASGAIPDDHPLNAGMVGLQTQHRYGNATFLESEFVLGIGNRWANRRSHRHRADADWPRFLLRSRHRFGRQIRARGAHRGGACRRARRQISPLQRLDREGRRPAASECS